MKTLYTLELSGLDAAGNPAVLRAADDTFVTGRADTPADTHYLRRLSQAGNFAAELFSGSALSGSSRTGGGEIVLANADGKLDDLLNWAVDGRALVVRRGNAGAAYPAAWQIVLRGTAAGLSARGNDLVIRLRDRAAELDTPMARPIYAGSNVLPDGVEGVEADQKGKTKPRVYGVVRNISPPCVNTARLIYQVSDRAANVTAVYDLGMPLTRGADYADLADLMAAAPAAGEYRALPALGLLRLGVQPAGQLTADATAAGAATAGSLLAQLAADGGVASGDVVASDVAALDTAAPYSLGLWLSDAETAGNAMDRVANSVGAWWSFDGLGMLHMARLDAPAGMPVAELSRARAGGLDLKDAPLPPSRVTVRYARNWTVQASGLAGGVAAETVSWLAAETRSATLPLPDNVTRHPLAEPLERDTLLADAAAAGAEASRLAALYTRRRIYTVSDVSLARLGGALPALGSVVRLVWDRYGLTAGLLTRVIGFDADLAADTATLTVWG